MYSQDEIDRLAGRIERAYCRRYPRWLAIGLTPGVWESAASRLLQVSVDSPNIPIDPELFVAVLAGGASSPDPWAELTQRRSQTRYLKALQRIIGQLRQELRREVRLAERQLSSGMSLNEVIDGANSRISPLTCYILAFRAGRQDLSFKHRAAAESQHRSCPLYRQASRLLLPTHAYPNSELSVDRHPIGREAFQFSLN